MNDAATRRNTHFLDLKTLPLLSFFTAVDFVGSLFSSQTHGQAKGRTILRKTGSEGMFIDDVKMV
jgi:hypothetical protein